MLVMIRYQIDAATNAGNVLYVREPMDESWKKGSVLRGNAISNEVSLTMAIVSLPVGGTMTRMAWGSTIRTMDLPLLMPSASAASAWPLSTDKMPARAISYM